MEFLLSLLSHIHFTPDAMSIVLLGIVLVFGIPAIRTAWRGGK